MSERSPASACSRGLNTDWSQYAHPVCGSARRAHTSAAVEATDAPLAASTRWWVAPNFGPIDSTPCETAGTPHAASTAGRNAETGRLRLKPL